MLVAYFAYILIHLINMLPFLSVNFLGILQYILIIVNLFLYVNLFCRHRVLLNLKLSRNSLYMYVQLKLGSKWIVKQT